MHSDMKMTSKICFFVPVWSLPQSSPHWLFFAFFHFVHRNAPFHWQMSLKQLAYGLNYDNSLSLSAFLPLNLNVFTIEHRVQTHFVPVLGTLSWTPNCSIVGCSFILEMVRYYYPQNIWYFEFAENCHFQFYFLEALFHKNLLAQNFCK